MEKNIQSLIQLFKDNIPETLQENFLYATLLMNRIRFGQKFLLSSFLEFINYIE